MKNSNQILINFHKYRLFDVILFVYENNTRLERMHKKAVFIGVQWRFCSREALFWVDQRRRRNLWHKQIHKWSIFANDSAVSMTTDPCRWHLDSWSLAILWANFSHRRAVRVRRFPYVCSDSVWFVQLICTPWNVQNQWPLLMILLHQSL